MVANRYSFNPTPNNQKKGIQACVLPFAALIRKHGEVFGGFAIFHLHGERHISKKDAFGATANADNSINNQRRRVSL